MTAFTAVIEYDPESKLYVGIVPGIPGAHSQGATLDELRANLEEVPALVMEENEDLRRHPPRIVGVQQIDVA
jgi:predicted RNase H-like HicB family nuclease